MREDWYKVIKNGDSENYSYGHINIFSTESALILWSVILSCLASILVTVWVVQISYIILKYFKKEMMRDTQKLQNYYK